VRVLKRRSTDFSMCRGGSFQPAFVVPGLFEFTD
jgi:hypothetical protein